MKDSNEIPQFLKNCNGNFIYTANKNMSINISVQSKNVRHFILDQFKNINLDKFIGYINNIKSETFTEYLKNHNIETIDPKQRFNLYLSITDKSIQHEYLYQTLVFTFESSKEDYKQQILIIDIPTFELENISIS